MLAVSCNITCHVLVAVCYSCYRCFQTICCCESYNEIYFILFTVIYPRVQDNFDYVTFVMIFLQTFDWEIPLASRNYPTALPSCFKTDFRYGFCTDSLKLPSFEFIYLLDTNHFNCSDYVHFFNIISQWTLSTQRQPHTAEMELISYSIPTYWQWRGIAGAEKLKIFRSLWTELTRLGGKFLCENLLFFWAWYFS